MRTLTRHLTVAAFCVASLALAPAALAAPTQVTLRLEGTHPVEGDYHQGTFTASAPLCASGSWLGNGAGSRVFTCTDGSGTFTADFNGELEHTQGATGPWAITGGTGTYAALRGKGTATIDSSTGINASPITFTDTWTGAVDFDATPPTGSVTAVKVARPRTSGGRWHVTVFFTARDNVDGNAVSFAATASAGPFFASKSGRTASGKGSLTFAFHRAKRTRVLRIEIELADPWGNASAIKKDVRLR